MSRKANFFKLGVFVLGAIVAGIAVLLIIGSGRWLQPRIEMESYFDESVQGLDLGSKVKYRGVVVGEVTKISFSYVKYENTVAAEKRHRYVLVEAKLQPKLVGGRSGDLANPQNAQAEIERGLRVKLAPLGITGTSYLEIDYVDPVANPELEYDWKPESLYIPSAKSTVQQFVNAASEIIERLRKIDIEGTIASVTTLLASLNERVGEFDTKAISQRADRTLAKMDRVLDGFQSKKISDEATRLLTELRASNADLRKTLANPAWQKLPEDASAAVKRIDQLVNDPKIARSVSDLQRVLGRLDRILGGGEAELASTIENLRQITDNLRDLTEDAKRYPGNILFGSPPRPLERKP